MVISDRRLAVMVFIILSVCRPTSRLQAKKMPITAWPFFYHRADQDSVRTDLIWPFLHFERNDTKTQYSLRPFIFSIESDPKDDFRKISLLLDLGHYQHKGKELSLHIFPVYRHGRFFNREYDTVFPFYWKGKGDDYSYLHIWPFFGNNHRGGSYVEYSTIYPFFRYGSDPQSEEINLHAPWPLVNVHHKANYSSRRFLPFYWSETGPDYGGGFVFPLYWRNTPSYSAKGAFPLWYSSRGLKLKTDLFFPIYFNRQTPKEHIRFITPLYMDRQWQTVLESRSGGQESHKLSLLIPFYFNYGSEDTGAKVILPNYFKYRSGAFSFSSLFPVYYHSRDTERLSEFNYYFPLYGSYQRGETVSRHLILFPLYSKLQDEKLQLKGWDLAWPFFHYETSPTTRSIRLLPFYWHSRGKAYELTMGFPFYWSFTQKDNAYKHLIPFYGVHTKGGWYKKRFIFGPLFIDIRDSRKGLYRQDVIFRIYSNEVRGNDKRLSWLIPFYYYKRNFDERLAMGSFAFLPPYYMHVEKKGDELFHIWPFYGKLKKGSYTEYSTLWPLFRLGRDSKNDVRLDHLLLYYHKDEKGRSVTSVFPLWWHKITTDTTQNSFLWRVVSYEQRGKENKEFRFLWRLIYSKKTEKSYAFEFNPLYYYEKEKAKGSYWALLGGLFGIETAMDQSKKMHFLWVFN